METVEKIENIYHSLLADQVLTNIRVTNPIGKISIRGKVISLNVFTIPNSSTPKWVYGSLLGEESTIDFKCHPDSAPEFVGQFVILEGTLDTSVNRFKSGLKVVLSGNVTGVWNPKNTNKYVHLDKDNGRIYLLDFLKQHDIKSLKILTTQVGYSDLISAFNKKMLGNDTQLNYEICSFYDKSTLIKSAKEAALEKNVKAIAFVRGGKGEKTMEVWNDSHFVSTLLNLNVPYYTAVGHTDPLYLAEKYSDEAFNNPNDIGNALSEAMTRLKSENDQKNIISRLGYKVNKSDETINNLTKIRDKQILSFKKWLFISLVINLFFSYFYF